MFKGGWNDFPHSIPNAPRTVRLLSVPANASVPPTVSLFLVADVDTTAAEQVVASINRGEGPLSFPANARHFLVDNNFDFAREILIEQVSSYRAQVR